PASSGADTQRAAKPRAPGGRGRPGFLGSANGGRQRRGDHRAGRAGRVSLLEVRGVSKRFGGLYALRDLDIAVETGEIVSVIGPNGAGKTTYFNVITGIYGPEAGQVVFEGHRLVGLKPNQITRLGVARTFQTVHLFPNMTVLENAMVGQHCRTRSGLFGAIVQPPRTKREEQRVREKAQAAP